MNHMGKTREFNTTTPEMHKIKGKISIEHDQRLGSMVIEKVDGKKEKQFVPGFPRIGYMESQVEGVPLIFDKNDGTNILFYPLYIKGKLAEVVPKTRGVPAAELIFLKVC